MHLCTNNTSYSLIYSLHSCSAWETALTVELSSVLQCKSHDLVMGQWSQSVTLDRNRETKTGHSFNDDVNCYDYKPRTASMEDKWNVSMKRWLNDTDMIRSTRKLVTVPLRLRIAYVLGRDWNRAFGVISKLLSAMAMQFPSHFPYRHIRCVNVTLFIRSNN